MAEACPNQELRCLLCCQNYKLPRELPCFHTFCSACLSSYIKAEHVTGDEDRPFFPCPACDRPTAPIEPNASVDNWASAFPINPIALAFIAENSDVQDCAACLRDEETNPAEVWCTFCTELLCKQCRISHKRNTTLLMSHQLGSDRQRFMTREKAKCQLLEHFRRLDKNKNTEKLPETFDIKLNMDTVIDDIMKLTAIGNIDMTSIMSPGSRNAFKSISSLLAKLLSMPSVAAFPSSESDLVDSLKCQKLNVWTESYSCIQTVKRHSLGGTAAPSLTGSTFTETGELLIIDFNNQRLLLFNDIYVYIKDYWINGQPTCIARGCVEHEVFVAVDRNSILRCKFQNRKLTVIRRIPCPQNTHSIAVHEETIVTGSVDKVDLLTMDGKVKKSVERRYFAPCVTVSDSMATFYHFDAAGGIVCRRIDNGEEVFTYNDITKPEDIKLDRDNNIYACGTSFGYIYLVSRDGSMGKEFIPRLASINGPWAMVVHPTKHELVVIAPGNSQETAFEVYGFCNAG